MADPKTLQLASNVKALVSGTVPTTTNLAKGEFAIGIVDDKYRIYANYDDTEVVEVGAFGETPETASVALDFQANHDYLKDEIIYHNRTIWRAVQDFTSDTDFVLTDWSSVAGEFIANFVEETLYLAQQVIVQDNKLYRAKITFTSGTEFDEDDWDIVGRDTIPAKDHIDWPTDDTFDIEVPAGRVLVFDQTKEPLFDTGATTEPFGYRFVGIPIGAYTDDYFGMWSTERYDEEIFFLGRFRVYRNGDGSIQNIIGTIVDYSGTDGWFADEYIVGDTLHGPIVVEGIEGTFDWNGSISVRDEAEKDLAGVEKDVIAFASNLDKSKASREVVLRQKFQTVYVSCTDDPNYDPMVDGQTYTIWVGTGASPYRTARRAWNQDGTQLTFANAVDRNIGELLLVDDDYQIKGFGKVITLPPGADNPTMTIVVTMVSDGSIPEYDGSANYAINAPVIYDGILYTALDRYDAPGDFDPDLWHKIGEEIPPITIPAFAFNTHYAKDAPVVQLGLLWTAKADFTSMDVWNESDWNAVGYQDIPDMRIPPYSASGKYVAASPVTYAGMLYTAKVAMTSPGPFDPSKWNAIGNVPPQTLPDFDIYTTYVQYAPVTCMGKLYKAKYDFVSEDAFNPDDWIEISAIPPTDPLTIQEFAPETYYVENAPVVHDGTLYRAIAAFESGEEFDAADWQAISIQVLPKTLIPTYSTTETYVTNAPVIYDGQLWVAKQNLNTPGAFDPTKWTKITNPVVIAPFTVDTSYVANQPVAAGGGIFTAKTDLPNYTLWDPNDWTRRSISSVSWGDILGSIVNQTDLNTLLTGLRTDVDSANNTLPTKANLITFAHIDWDPTDFDIPAGRSLQFDETKVPVLTADPSSMDTIAVFSQVNGQSNLLFGFWSDDKGTTTHAGLFKMNDDHTELVSIVDIYDGTNWINNGIYTLRYGIAGDMNQKFGTDVVLEGFDLTTDITVLDIAPKDLIDVYNELAEKQNDLTAVDNLQIDRTDALNPKISAIVTTPSVESGSKDIASAKDTYAMIQEVAENGKNRGSYDQAFTALPIYTTGTVQVVDGGSGYVVGDLVYPVGIDGDVWEVATLLNQEGSVASLTVSSTAYKYVGYGGKTYKTTGGTGSGLTAIPGLTSSAGTVLVTEVTDPREGDYAYVRYDENSSRYGESWRYDWGKMGGASEDTWNPTVQVNENPRDFRIDQIQNDELHDDAVSTSKIVNESVTLAKIDPTVLTPFERTVNKINTIDQENPSTQKYPTEKAVVDQVRFYGEKYRGSYDSEADLDNITDPVEGNWVYVKAAENNGDVSARFEYDSSVPEWTLTDILPQLFEDKVLQQQDVAKLGESLVVGEDGLVDTARMVASVNGINPDSSTGDVQDVYRFATQADWDAGKDSIPPGAWYIQEYINPDDVNAMYTIDGSTIMFYLSPSGLDSNSGRFPDQPMLNFDALIKKIHDDQYLPLNYTITINLAAGEYILPTNYYVQPIIGRIIIIDGASTATTTVVVDGTTNSGWMFIDYEAVTVQNLTITGSVVNSEQGLLYFFRNRAYIVNVLFVAQDNGSNYSGVTCEAMPASFYGCAWKNCPKAIRVNYTDAHVFGTVSANTTGNKLFIEVINGIANVQTPSSTWATTLYTTSQSGRVIIGTGRDNTTEWPNYNIPESVMTIFTTKGFLAINDPNYPIKAFRDSMVPGVRYVGTGTMTETAVNTPPGITPVTYDFNIEMWKVPNSGTTANSGFMEIHVGHQFSVGYNKNRHFRGAWGVTGSSPDSAPVWIEIDGTPAYSLTETRVGTWIDGRTIYRRVFDSTTGLGNLGGLTANTNIIKLFSSIISNFSLTIDASNLFVSVGELTDPVPIGTPCTNGTAISTNLMHTLYRRQGIVFYNNWSQSYSTGTIIMLHGYMDYVKTT